MQAFDSISRGIKDNLSSFSWALGNWSDGLVKYYMNDLISGQSMAEIRNLDVIIASCCVMRKVHNLKKNKSRLERYS